MAVSQGSEPSGWGDWTGPSWGASTCDQWSVADVAAHLGVRPKTVTGYLAKGQMPRPDGRLGRTPWWWSGTIVAWAKDRPRTPTR